MRRLHLIFIKHKTIILDRLKHALILLIVLLFSQNSIAQNNNTSIELIEIDTKINESIYITPITNAYLSGETLRYKLFCINKTNNTASIYSKIAYVELIDHDKKSIFTHKLFLENGTANGDYFIPINLETGNYKLIGYTNWMLNKSYPDYFNIDIYIVNPYQSDNQNAIFETQDKNIEEKNHTPQDLAASSINSNANIKIELDKKVYSKREQINIKIKTNSEDFLKGNYSLSVRKMDGLLLNNKLSFNEYQNSNIDRVSNNTINRLNFVLPELRGEIIVGKIVAKKTENSLENKNLALSIPGQNFEFKISKTDKNGNFLFILDKPSSNSNVIIQLIDSDKENYTIEIDKPKTPNYSKLTFNHNIAFNSNFNKNVKERAVSSQIENAYYNLTKDSVAPQKIATKFYEPIAKEYILDDYTRFATLKETTVEIVKEMYYTQTKNNYELRLNNNALNNAVNSKIEMPTLVLVDGLIIEDMNELFDYKMSNIHKISISNGGYYYGTKTFESLISFTTKNFDYASKLSGSFIIKPEILRPLSKKDYYQPDYTNKNKNSRIPDYRHQLLWLPELLLKEKENLITFYTADVTGIFEITLEGFTNEGKPVSLIENFQVN